jgi:hypothetical protein
MIADASRLISSEGGLDLRILVRRIWGGQLIIWAVALLCVALAILYLQNATYKYTVNYEVTPAQGSSNGLSATLGKAGGIAQLAGIDLPQSGDSSYKLYLEGVQSRDVAEVLSHDQQLMQTVFPEEWDPVAKSWHEPRGVVRDVRNSVKRFVNFPGPWWHQPDGARLHEVLLDQIDVLQDSKAGTATISMKSADPRYAIILFSKLHQATDGLLRQRALVRIDDYLHYLTEKLSIVSLAENRAALAQALGDQERARMFASSPRSFAAEIFQNPASSITPTSPRPLLLLIGAFVAGMLIGLTIVIVRIFLKEFALEASLSSPTA